MYATYLIPITCIITHRCSIDIVILKPKCKSNQQVPKRWDPTRSILHTVWMWRLLFVFQGLCHVSPCYSIPAWRALQGCFTVIKKRYNIIYIYTFIYILYTFIYIIYIYIYISSTSPSNSHQTIQIHLTTPTSPPFSSNKNWSKFTRKSPAPKSLLLLNHINLCRWLCYQTKRPGGHAIRKLVASNLPATINTESWKRAIMQELGTSAKTERQGFRSVPPL